MGNTCTVIMLIAIGVLWGQIPARNGSYGGPFANIAHWLATPFLPQNGHDIRRLCSDGSRFSELTWVRRSFYNIKCRKSGLQPKLTIIVATAQGLKMHGGVSLDRIKEPNMEGLKEGFGNLDETCTQFAFIRPAGHRGIQPFCQ